MSQEKGNKEQVIKRMADLLRRGATLTDLACPACASPLFRLKSGELWCEACEKRVIVVAEGEDVTKVTEAMTLKTLEQTLLSKVEEIQDRIQRETNIDELKKLSAALSELLESLERIRRTKRW